MNEFPPLRPVADAPDELLSGHLWLLELIDGRPLRFQLQDSGLLRVGDAKTVYDDPNAIPLPFRCAVRHIRESLDRDALRAAVDNVEGVTFYGVATTRESVPYDLASMPSFLGTDVWAVDDEAFRPPDAVDGIFRRLGLDPVNTFAREAHARDFSVADYEIPRSAWYDGPAAGVVIRNKQGHRGMVSGAAMPTSAPPSGANKPEAIPSIDALVTEDATKERIEEIAASLRAAEQPVVVDTVTDRLCATVGRHHPAAFLGADRLDQAAFRSAVAEQVQRQLQP